MKTFQKIALVSAIAAAPFAAQADLTPMDDSLMGNTTGQAGVTIEIDLGDSGISVGSVVYTDHELVNDGTGKAPGDAGYVDTYSSGALDGGSVALENINVNLTGTLVQTIDVSEDGDLEMTMSSPGSLNISMGDDGTGNFSALKLVSGTYGSTANESEIINNLDLALELGASTTTIVNLGGAQKTVADRSGAEFTVGDPAFSQDAVDAADAADAAMPVDNALANIGLGRLADAGVTGSYANDTSSMAIQMNASIKITDMNLGLFGYTATQANTLGQSHGATVAAKATLVGSAAGTLTFDADGVATSTDAGDALAVGTYNGTLSGIKTAIASGSAIEINGVTVESSTGGAIALNQTIWAVGGDASLPGSKSGVYIQMGAMDMNIGVEGIEIGGSSIGSLAVNNLQLNGMTQRIYGH